jgi:uncharacterized protein (DUF736 family)
MMDKKDIGAFWERQSKAGKTYLSGSIEIDGKRIEIIAFRNDKGDNAKRPDWKVYPSEPLGDKTENIPF